MRASTFSEEIAQVTELGISTDARLSVLEMSCLTEADSFAAIQATAYCSELAQ